MIARLDLDRRLVPPSDVPEPYKSLLVHDHDMTSTLAAFHQHEILLKVLEREADATHCSRVVILRAGEKPVEYGWILMYLDAFSEKAQALILEGVKPLGWILEHCQVQYQCDPLVFFEVSADEALKTHLGTDRDVLYGRENRITSYEGDRLAEVLEILP